MFLIISNLQVVLFCLVIFLFVLLFAGKNSLKRKRHEHNVKQAQVILNKIRCFDDEHYKGKVFNYLRKISPYVFEELLLTCLQEKGYEIKRNFNYSHDGGIDGKVFCINGLILIQAKRYQGYIHRKHVSEFSGKVNKHKAYKGFFIHTGRTPKSMLQLFHYSNVEIISGEKLLDLVLNSAKTRSFQESMH